jgi:hypothetical protein
VVGDPMLNTRGWSCFSQLTTGGVGKISGKLAMLRSFNWSREATRRLKR